MVFRDLRTRFGEDPDDYVVGGLATMAVPTAGVCVLSLSPLVTACHYGAVLPLLWPPVVARVLWPVGVNLLHVTRLESKGVTGCDNV